MSGQDVLELTDGNFEAEVLESELPVLVDFWAEWCMPCKMIAPTIDQVAAEYKGKVKVGKVDIDTNRNVPTQFGVSAIPTLVVFHGGQVVKKFVGLQQKKDLKVAIDDILAKPPATK